MLDDETGQGFMTAHYFWMSAFLGIFYLEVKNCRPLSRCTAVVTSAVTRTQTVLRLEHVYIQFTN